MSCELCKDTYVLENSEACPECILCTRCMRKINDNNPEVNDEGQCLYCHTGSV